MLDKCHFSFYTIGIDNTIHMDGEEMVYAR
jgi:hypothetical protein